MVNLSAERDIMKDWKKAEAIVYKYFSEQKGSFIHRFIDTHDINAQLGRFKEGKEMVFTYRKPSDFIVTYHGNTFYAEVKTTVNVKGTTNALFSEQEGMRNRILKADGRYFYFIYSFIKNQWYVVPGFIIAENPNRKWEEIDNFKVDYLCAIS